MAKGDDKDSETTEARTYLDRADDKKKKKRGITPQSQKKSRWGGGGYGKGEEVEVDESTAKYAKSLEKIANDKALKMLTKSERENLKKIATLLSKEKTLGEAYKDLPPHLQKLIKRIGINKIQMLKLKHLSTIQRQENLT